MKVLAFNCSPKMDEGNTAMILNPFLEGMREAGAEVELYYTRKLDIKPCLGDFHCWFRHPGVCIHKDDMRMLLPKIAEADVRVLATPLYADGVSGPLKNLMDRGIPLGQPFLEFRDGRVRHPMAEGYKGGKIVLVSTCGLWEMTNFEALLAHIRAYCNNMVREFSGALLRPHASAMKFLPAAGVPVDDIFQAARQAGAQLVKEGKMHPETLSTISRELMPVEEFVERLNAFMRQAMSEGRRDPSVT